MKAVVYTGDNSAEYMDVDNPVKQEGQTRVDLFFCGICGSDMHAWHGHDERRVLRLCWDTKLLVWPKMAPMKAI